MIVIAEYLKIYSIMMDKYRFDEIADRMLIIISLYTAHTQTLLWVGKVSWRG